MVITVDQHSTLIKEVLIETHYEGGKGDADGRIRDAKHGDKPAYKGQLLRIFLRLKETSEELAAGSEEGGGGGSRYKKNIEVGVRCRGLRVREEGHRA